MLLSFTPCPDLLQAPSGIPEMKKHVPGSQALSLSFQKQLPLHRGSGFSSAAGALTNTLSSLRPSTFLSLRPVTDFWCSFYQSRHLACGAVPPGHFSAGSDIQAGFQVDDIPDFPFLLQIHTELCQIAWIFLL